MSSAYISVFKLDGVPILPPVMTKTRREEMRVFRELARKVEQRVLERKSNLLQEDVVDNISHAEPVNIQEKEVISPEVDCDETATSETLPTDVFCPESPEDHPKITTPIATEIQSLDCVPQKKNPLLEEVKELATPKLIRSNSYTLDHPSPMLLKFLDGNKKLNKSASSTPKKPSPGNRKTPRKSLDQPKLRSIYGIKTPPVRKSKSEALDDTKRRLKIHSRGEKVEQFFMKSKSVKDFENLTQKPKTTAIAVIESDSTPEKDCPEVVHKEVVINRRHSLDNVLEQVAEDHKRQQDELILRQRDEQQRLLDQLNVQQQKQQLLVHKLEELNLMDRTSTPLQRMTSIEDSQSEPDGQFNETSFYSTIRGESPTIRGDSPTCSMSLVSDAYSKQYLHSIRSFTASPLTRQKEIEGNAATIINSHIRGYLIRRLLRTEFVQNIIDNIKNILFLILDSNPKDIQLKRSYLIQLNSNCERLHDVFFKFSIKERMAVINKDRELLLQRLSQRRISKRGTK